LSSDCCYATELRVLCREAQKLKLVMSDSHYVFPLVAGRLLTACI
jgi:hypothetical protein